MKAIVDIEPGPARFRASRRDEGVELHAAEGRGPTADQWCPTALLSGLLFRKLDQVTTIQKPHYSQYVPIIMVIQNKFLISKPVIELQAQLG